jgi:hypothetical protein
MPQQWLRATRLASKLAGTVATVLAFSLSAGSGPAQAVPWAAEGLAAPSSQVVQARIYRRGRPPIYPYYYNPGRPGGYSFYFGFVPYAKGDYGTQALNRSLYPQDIQWPPSMYRYGPRPGWGPKPSD